LSNFELFEYPVLAFPTPLLRTIVAVQDRSGAESVNREAL